MLCAAPVVSEAASMGVIGEINSRVARGGVEVRGKSHSIAQPKGSKRAGARCFKEGRTTLCIRLTAYREARENDVQRSVLGKFYSVRGYCFKTTMIFRVTLPSISKIVSMSQNSKSDFRTRSATLQTFQISNIQSEILGKTSTVIINH